MHLIRSFWNNSEFGEVSDSLVISPVQEHTKSNPVNKTRVKGFINFFGWIDMDKITDSSAKQNKKRPL